MQQLTKKKPQECNVKLVLIEQSTPKSLSVMRGEAQCARKLENNQQTCIDKKWRAEEKRSYKRMQ